MPLGDKTEKKGEYAKIVRIAPNAATSKGFQATLTLPSAKSFNGDSDFINFYCGINGFECGISTGKRIEFYSGGVYKWHWVVAGQTVSGPMDYKDGDQVSILLAIDETQGNKLVFRVNQVQKFITTAAYNASADNRFMIGAAQSAMYSNGNLVAWNLTHNQVTVSAMKYKDTNNVWQTITSANAAYDSYNTPLSVKPADFPPISNYTVTAALGNAMLYAAIK